MELKSIKLKTGEVLVCAIEKENFDLNQRFVKLINPISFHSVRSLNTAGHVIETISMAPFMVTSIQAEIHVASDSIMSVCSPSMESMRRYTQFVAVIEREGQDRAFGIEEGPPSDEPTTVEEAAKQIDVLEDMIAEFMEGLPVPEKTKLH